MTETRTRTMVRAISYRIIATLITAIFTGFETAVILHIILTVIHYAMERAWLGVSWGKSQ